MSKEEEDAQTWWKDRERSAFSPLQRTICERRQQNGKSRVHHDVTKKEGAEQQVALLAKGDDRFGLLSF